MSALGTHQPVSFICFGFGFCQGLNCDLEIVFFPLQKRKRRQPSQAHYFSVPVVSNLMIFFSPFFCFSVSFSSCFFLVFHVPHDDDYDIDKERTSSSHFPKIDIILWNPSLMSSESSSDGPVCDKSE